METTCAGFVPTRGAAFNKLAQDDFQVVSYESYKSKRHRGGGENKPEAKKTVEDDRKGIDIKRARREIIKFGMNGFDTKKKQEAKIALAVSLGAKPPKNPYRNYKELLDEKRQIKAESDSLKNLQQAGKNALGVSVAKKNFNHNKTKAPPKNMRGSLLEAYGKPTGIAANKKANARFKKTKK